MPIEFKKQKVVLRGAVTVEEAEALLEWLQNKPAAKVDLSACSHVHTASLQVLMAAKSKVASWPADSDLRAWLETALKSA
jgi:anti-anti-sigma regulatory factor